MEETEFTSEELEYLELVKWVIDYTKKRLNNGNEDDRKTAEKCLIEYHDTEAKVRTFAKMRTKHLREVEIENNRHKDEFHEVRCSKCKSVFALKPVGEQKNKQEYLCNTFLCPHCKESFCNWVPISDRGKVELGELVLEAMKKNKEPQDKIKAYKKSMTILEYL